MIEDKDVQSNIRYTDINMSYFCLSSDSQFVFVFE